MLVKWHQVVGLFFFFWSHSGFSFHSAARTVFKFCRSSPFSAEQTLLILYCLYFLLMVVPIISLSQAYYICPNCFTAFKRASAFWKSPPCPAWKCSLHSHPTNLCTTDSPLMSPFTPGDFMCKVRSEPIRCVQWMTEIKKSRFLHTN